jgi:hypothetical protein
MKELYSFEVNRKKMVEEVEDQGDGKKIVETVEKLVPVKVVLKNPSRIEKKILETFHHSVYSEAMKKGIVTRAMIKKAYNENGGVFSETQEKERQKLLKEYSELQSGIQLEEINAKEAKNKKAKEEHDKKAQELFQKFIEIHQALEKFRAEEEEIYANSAENLARDKTIEWLICNLVFLEEDGVQTSPFVGDTIEEKNDYYENLMDEEKDFYGELLEKASTVLSMWYVGRANTKEDFDEIFEILYKK